MCIESKDYFCMLLCNNNMTIINMIMLHLVNWAVNSSKVSHRVLFNKLEYVSIMLV